MLHPVLGPLFFGKIISAAGIWIHNIVAAILTYELTDSVLLVGMVSALQFAPQLVLAPLSGALADRGHATSQIVLGRLVTALGSGGLALWTWIGPEVSGVRAAGPVLLASLVVGVGFVIGGPAMHSIIPSLVRRSELGAAVTLNTIPLTTARAAGPALGAYVALHLGVSVAFAVAALANTLFCLIALHVLPKDVRKPGKVDGSIREGMRYIRSDRSMVLLLLGIAAVAFGAEPSLTLTPAISTDLIGTTEFTGWLASAFGTGAGAGFAALALLRRGFGYPVASVAGLSLMAAGLLSLLVAWHPASAMAGFFLCGSGMTLASTSLATQIQQRAPEALRGRIMAVWLMASLGARPVAAAMDGALAEALSVPFALVASAGIVIVSAYLCRPSQLTLPLPQESTSRADANQSDAAQPAT